MANQPPNNSLDLSQLAVDRQPKAKASVKYRRAWVTRYGLPVTIILAFVGLFSWAARDTFLPATPVTITPVVVSRAEVKQEGTPLFQAAGWIEPRPSPVIASSLAPGVISNLLVIEGQRVAKDEPVAKLIDIDAKIALGNAEAQHQLQAAEVRRAKAALIAAKSNLENPIELQAALADAEAAAAETNLLLVNLPYALETAKTELELAQDNFDRKKQAGDAVSGRVLREAEAELATAKNKVQEIAARQPTLQAQLIALKKRSEALAQKLELKTELIRAHAIAETNLAAAQAKLQQTEFAVQTARLTLDRMTVLSPIEGRILSLEARPGQRLAGLNPHSEQGASAVVSLYDPTSLQVRVDVRLEDIPQVQIGQPTQIETAAISQPIQGEVISITTRADIQKNTLQVKVAILNPPDVIKPEMLAKVTFLAPPTKATPTTDNQVALRLFVPQSLVIPSDSGETVWKANLTTRTAHLQTVQIGAQAATGGLVEIISGLTPTDKLIVSGRAGLAEASRITITGEDTTFSTNTAQSNTSIQSQ